MARDLPRPFNYHWGSGQIVEEAAHLGEHHEAAIQLLEYDGGDHEGAWSIRFCFYNPAGRFQRSPLLIGDAELDGLRAALRKSPRLKKLLTRLVRA